jgi:hypothetical protein
VANTEYMDAPGTVIITSSNDRTDLACTDVEPDENLLSLVHQLILV